MHWWYERSGRFQNRYQCSREYAYWKRVCMCLFLKNRQCHGIRWNILNVSCSMCVVVLVLVVVFFHIFFYSFFWLFLCAFLSYRYDLVRFALVSFGFSKPYVSDRFVRSFFSLYHSMDHMSWLSVLVLTLPSSIHFVSCFRYIECLVYTKHYNFVLCFSFVSTLSLFGSSCVCVCVCFCFYFFLLVCVNVFVMPCNFGVLSSYQWKK